MWWNFVSVEFLGLYAFLLAVMGSFNYTGYLQLSCEPGLRDDTVWEADNGFSEIFVTMHLTLIIMSATFDYFIYFSIPFRLNRITKSQKEIDVEARDKLNLLKKSKSNQKVRCCLCCKYKVSNKKKKKSTRKGKGHSIKHNDNRDGSNN